jgi:urease accessory protein
MTDLARARAVLPPGGWSGPACDSVVLDYEGRFVRRKRLATASGASVLVDLPQTVSLEDGAALVLGDGGRVRVVAAAEAVVIVSGDLPRLAWHIGNRHTPCAIGADHLMIRRDHVLEAMLARLGAKLIPTEAPFTPEGGAYGHGRTLGHHHGDGHDHDDHDHDHHHHDHGGAHER